MNEEIDGKMNRYIMKQKEIIKIKTKIIINNNNKNNKKIIKPTPSQQDHSKTVSFSRQHSSPHPSLPPACLHLHGQ